MQDGLYGGVLKVRRVAVVGVAVFGVGRVVGGHGEAPFFGRMDVDFAVEGRVVRVAPHGLPCDFGIRSLGSFTHPATRAASRSGRRRVRGTRAERSGGPFAHRSDVHRARASTLTANPP